MSSGGVWGVGKTVEGGVSVGGGGFGVSGGGGGGVW